jgi:hypothetical protein
MTLADLGKDGRSTLLYLETRAVDHGGRVQIQHMNELDQAQAERWALDGFIQYGRLKTKDIYSVGVTHWVHLTAHAMKLAHEERRARAERMWKARNFTTIET